MAADALVKELARTGAAGLAVGERDLAAGLDAYVRRVTEAKLPVLASNLLSKATGKPPFPGRRIVEVGGIKVGLAGVVEAAPFARVADVTVSPDFAQAAAAERKALQAEGAQLFVLLAHTSLRSMKELKPPAPPIAGWNVIVTGHDRRGRETPERIGGALIVSGGDRGRQIGHLTLTLEGPPPWTELADAGEVAMLKEEISRMAERRKYYERMMEREGIKEQSKKFYGDRLVQMDADRAEKQVLLAAAKARPLQGNRFELAMAPMNDQIPDDPECAKALAPAVQRLAVLKPGGAHGGGDDHVGHDHGGKGGHDHAGHSHGPKAIRKPKAAAGPRSGGSAAPKKRPSPPPAAASPRSAPAGPGR